MYRSFKIFDLDVFNNTLNVELHNIGNNNSYTLFEEKFLSVLNKQVPLKAKLLRYNNNAFITKELKNSIILRSKLKNTFNEKRSHENWCKYRRQRN